MTATYLLLAAAAALFFWPSTKGRQHAAMKSPTPFDIPAPQKGHPAYQAAIMALTLVRQRLIATDALSDKEKAAIDTITLSLVAGSDRE